MRTEQLAEIRSWFEAYVAGFASDGGRLSPALQIKADHSKRVAVEARGLARAIGWPTSRINLAEALGLLHDLGRFSQYSEHGTFSDAASIDHGERGWLVAASIAPLSRLTRRERESILHGIRFHNRQAVPEGIPPWSLPYLKLIRDSDKLDIFRIVLDAVEQDGFRALPGMLPGITLDRSCSEPVVEELACGRVCSLKNVRTLGDFLLLQLSWVNDVNYAPALRLLLDRDVFSRIMLHLNGARRVQLLGLKMRRSAIERLGAASRSCSDCSGSCEST
ncbi:MAG: HD domain-containing protein [Vicinamibacteria bacterium]|nr:HD domain-containing protein [Vicinamibacteria bacterium]